MTTKAAKRNRDEELLPEGWQPIGERAPSVIRSEGVNAPRIIAMIALLVAAVGALAMTLNVYNYRAVLGAMIGFGGGLFLVMFGMAGLVYHAFNEKDLQLRRVYGLFGAVQIAIGVVFSLLPGSGENAPIGAYFLSTGAPALGLGLCFLVSFIRNEREGFLHELAVRLVLGAGVLMIGIGLIGGIVNESFLMGRGVVYLVLGFLYLASYIGIQPHDSEKGYWAAFAMGVVGSAMIVIVLGWAIPFGSVPLIGPYIGWINNLFGFVRWVSGQPGAPFLFVYVGLEFLLLAVFVCSDNQIVVMARREFAAYFYSPIAYMVMVAIALLAGVSFFLFTLGLAEESSRFGGSLEPILLRYFFGIMPVFAVILGIPVITMRLFSEEQRMGTLEVLFTAPVSETAVVLSKFLAALRFYLLTWIPWAIYLIALRVEVDSQFDYRVLLSFLIGITAIGAGFIAIGTFFSSLTKNQIIASILTLVTLLSLLGLTFLQSFLQDQPFWSELLNYFSFLTLWYESSRGVVAPRFLILHVSIAAFFLFLTVKVLESRKWR